MVLRSIVVAIVLSGAVCGAGIALADDGPALPLPGLTPSNFFYFLDRLGETLQEIFTFGAGSKAKLQIQFAAERAAEISLEKGIRGDDSPGVEVAKTRFSGHLEAAEVILDEAEAEGEEVQDDRLEIIEGVNDIFEKADWLDDFMEETDEIGNLLGIPDEGELDEEAEDALRELEELESQL